MQRSQKAPSHKARKRVESVSSGSCSDGEMKDGGEGSRIEMKKTGSPPF